MRYLRGLSQEKIVFALSVALFVACSASLSGFLTAPNLIAVIRSVSVLGILAIGMADRHHRPRHRSFDDRHHGDLGRLVSSTSEQSIPLGSALALALAGVVAIGLVNGFLIAYAEVPAIFATLATGAFVFGFGARN